MYCLVFLQKGADVVTVALFSRVIIYEIGQDSSPWKPSFFYLLYINNTQLLQ